MQKTRLLFPMALGGIKTCIEGEAMDLTEDSMDKEVEVEHPMSNRRPEKKDEKGKVTRCRFCGFPLVFTTLVALKNEWEEKGVYVAFEIDTVQKHKVEHTGPRKYPSTQRKL